MNSSPTAIAALNDVPIRQVNGRTIFIRDVAQVRDGFTVQTQVVRENGRRGVLLTVLKNGNSSTLQNRTAGERSPASIRRDAEGMKIQLVTGSEPLCRSEHPQRADRRRDRGRLTGLMILLFLGSWRSTLIVTISIPLSILVAIVTLSAMGQTLNIMTLGGLALAVGILGGRCHGRDRKHPPQHRHGQAAEARDPRRRQQIAVPAFVATTAISIVFLSGPLPWKATPAICSWAWHWRSVSA
jgi:multidrug efflux pump subunit AcrB